MADAIDEDMDIRAVTVAALIGSVTLGGIAADGRTMLEPAHEAPGSPSSPITAPHGSDRGATSLGSATPDAATERPARLAPVVDPPPPEFVDLVYGPDDQHRLDVHLPPHGTGHGGSIVWIHGGAWVGGSKELGPDEHLVQSLRLDHGWTVFTIGYRTAPEHPFPAAVHDVDQAVRWVTAHATRFGVDPSRIVVGGWSAGGHLAVSHGASESTPWVRSGPLTTLPWPAADPAAIVSIAAPLDPRAWGNAMPLDNPFSGSAAIAAFAGCDGSTHLGCTSEELDAIDPTLRIADSTPPVHLVHGDLDGIVPLESQLDAIDRVVEHLPAGTVSVDLVTDGPAVHRNHAVDLGLDLTALLDFLDDHVVGNPATGS